MFEGMTARQIQDLMIQAQQALEEALERESTISGERDGRVRDAITKLTDLIGSEDGPANLTTIRGIQKYTDAQIAANPVLAVRLILEGLEQLALTARDIAETIID